MKHQKYFPIYEGLYPYRLDVAILKDYGGKRKKLIYCNQIKQSGVEKADLSDGKKYIASVYTEKNSINENKLCNNLSRAKSKIQELVLCNEWQYFFTATLNPQKYVREDLPTFRKDFSRFCRDIGKKHAAKIRYLVVPEQHAQGGWHMHGFLAGIPPELLRRFTLTERLPLTLRKKLLKEEEIFDWPAYQEKFGFCDLEPIKNITAAAFYATKYVTKDNSKNVQTLGGHLYYASQGLQRADVMKVGKMDVNAVDWDFENKYVKIKWFRASEHPEYLISRDNTIQLLRQRRDAARQAATEQMNKAVRSSEK